MCDVHVVCDAWCVCVIMYIGTDDDVTMVMMMKTMADDDADDDPKLRTL